MPYSTGDFPVMADGRIVGKVNIEQNGLMLVFDCTCSYRSHEILRLAAVCGGKYVPLGILMPKAGNPDADVLSLKKSLTKNTLTSIGYDNAASYHLIRQGELYPEVGLPAFESETIVYNDFPDPVDYAYDFESEPSAAAGESDPSAEDRLPEPEENLPEPGIITQDQEAASLIQEPVTQIKEIEPIAINAAPAIAAPDRAPSAVNGWMTISNPRVLFNDQTIQESCDGISNALITEQDGYTLLAVPVLAAEPFPMMPVFCFGSSGDIGGQECIIFKIKNGNLTL